MKKFNSIILAVILLFSYQLSIAQTGVMCDGNKGPNLLGARGTFSVPFITVNNNADPRLHSGAGTYSPIDNVGNKIEGCSAPTGSIIPCSDYNYTDQYMGMMPEFTYSILRSIGDASGFNPIHTQMWEASDHTGDGGYFLAVNGAADISQTPIFYQIRSIPVCIGATYEFSAYVTNLFPGNGTSVSSTDPSITFVVNGTDTIATSGRIPKGAGWIKVGGSFVATTSTVDLKVVNSTFVAGGNDLGLDDISINVCQSQIVAPSSVLSCEGNTITPQFTVFDPTAVFTSGGTYKYYKIDVSRDSKITWSNRTSGMITYDNTGTGIISYDITNTSTNPNDANANGNVYRLSVATSLPGLSNPECIYFNDYTLRVASCGPTPVKLVSFNGTYADGVANLNWQTSQELNNDRFELFRSYDGNDFELAASVAGAGNSYTPKSYSYQDRIGAAQGNYVFYKLKQIDKDGKFTFSNVIKLSLSNAASSFQVFPNPVMNNFTASFSAPKTTTATLLIRNTSGQTVFRKTVDVIKGNNSVQVNVPQLNTGMYYLNVVNDEINYNAKIQKL